MMMQSTFADVPVFDLNGPAFLILYGVCLLIAICWSFFRSRGALNRFDRQGYDPQLTDPYDIAYLAAGVPRVAQLAVVRLMQSGHIEWKSGLLIKRLIALNPTGGDAHNRIERTLRQAVQNNGRQGLPVTQAIPTLQSEIRPFEVKLAAAGLRPTAKERSSAGRAAALPLIILFVIGCIKLGLGISRDKPVGFLVVLLIATLILVVVVGASTRRLTKSGEALLGNLRSPRNTPRKTPGDDDTISFEKICWNFALTGTAVLAGIPAYAAMHRELAQMHGAGAGASSGGCGSASGCGGGSSGCGGGAGCGGCGGGD